MTPAAWRRRVARAAQKLRDQASEWLTEPIPDERIEAYGVLDPEPTIRFDPGDLAGLAPANTATHLQPRWTPEPPAKPIIELEPGHDCVSLHVHRVLTAADLDRAQAADWRAYADHLRQWWARQLAKRRP